MRLRKLLYLFVFFIPFSSAFAFDEPQFLLKGKVGYALFREVSPVTSAFIYGVDFGIRLESGFSFQTHALTGKGSGSENVSSTVVRDETDRLTFFGVSASYGFEKAGAIFYVGPMLGMIIQNSDVTTIDTSIPTRTVTSESPSYLGLGFLVGLDLPLRENYFATIATEALASFDRQKPWLIGIRAGLGFSF